MFGISLRVFTVPPIHPYLLELQHNIILWIKAQLRLRTNGNKQMTDPSVDSHPVGLLVALITAEDKIISDVYKMATKN